MHLLKRRKEASSHRLLWEGQRNRPLGAREQHSERGAHGQQQQNWADTFRLEKSRKKTKANPLQWGPGKEGASRDMDCGQTTPLHSYRAPVQLWQWIRWLINSITTIHNQSKEVQPSKQRKNNTDTRYDLVGLPSFTQIACWTHVNHLSPPERGNQVLPQRHRNGKMGETRLSFLSLQASRKAISTTSKKSLHLPSFAIIEKKNTDGAVYVFNKWLLWLYTPLQLGI